MLDLGLPELLLIAAVAILVAGPQDIPRLMQGAGRIVRRLQYMRFALSQQFDDYMQKSEIDALRAEAERKPETDDTEEAEEDERNHRSSDHPLIR